MTGARGAWIALAVAFPGGGDGPQERAQPWFVDVAEATGLAAFRQVNGDPEKTHISAANGAGLALFDCDGDGDLDVFFVSGSRLGPKPQRDAPTNRLFRNEGRGERFVEVTEAAGLNSRGTFGQGCAVADVNGDGRLDVFVANIGPDALYLNAGDGAFRECAAEAGIADPRWSSGGTFLDYDRDGDLDLYVARYVALEPGTVEQGPKKLLFSEWKGQRVFKGPHELPGERDTLYRNEGNGTFTDVTAAAGMGKAPAAYGFQPVAFDGDDDGDLDLFVANDSMANFLWRNDGDGTFSDFGLVSGLAYNQDGRPQSCMGVAAADEDGDGRCDLFVTNFSDELNTLYRNRGAGLFDDVTLAVGLGGFDVVRSLAWGTTFFDADDDGDLDLFVANGHVYPQADRVGSGYGYGQRNFLFAGSGGGRFRDVTASAGPGFEPERVSRGAAAGDLDDDGDVDLVVNNLDDRPTVLRNDTAPRGHFVRVKLLGRPPNCAAIGARVRVTAAGRTQRREVLSSSSYVSHEDLRAHFGIGETTQVERVEVRWPEGGVESVAGPPCDRLLVIEQGRGLVQALTLRS